MSRREMLRRSACGFGYIALSSLLSSPALGSAPAGNPLAPKAGRLVPRARRVIFLFMHGGPSHVDTFDYKPRLTKDHGKPAGSSPKIEPGSPVMMGNLLASPWEFRPCGQSGLMISSVFPEIGRCADDLCLVRSMHTNGQDHGQAVLKLHTGSNTQVRPSLGSWIIYGLGTENQNLPGFVTISPSMINGGPQNYGSAFLPAVFQGTPFGNENTPLTQAQIRHIRNTRLPLELQRHQLDFLQQLNRAHLERTALDAQLEGVIESYELAFRMQTETPGLTDLSNESEATLKLYGINEGASDNFGRQCLLARRFAEQGVRFIQVNHAFRWDQHTNLKRDLERNAAEIDRPVAGLLRDLKSRGLLEDTLVIWGGEFGRTPTAQGNLDGRDHNPHGFTVWLAGGGVKGGFSYGSTDEHGFQAVENKVHTHDLHATILHLLGLDHQKLTYRYGGRDFRLTDVYGNVVHDILA